MHMLALAVQMSGQHICPLVLLIVCAHLRCLWWCTSWLLVVQGGRGSMQAVLFTLIQPFYTRSVLLLTKPL